MWGLNNYLSSTQRIKRTLTVQFNNNPFQLIINHQSNKQLQNKRFIFADTDTSYYLGGKKQMTGMIAAPILIGSDTFICVVVVIYNLIEKRLYLHETFLTEKIPEIAASSLVRGSTAASPQSQGSIAKILQGLLKSK